MADDRTGTGRRPLQDAAASVSLAMQERLIESLYDYDRFRFDRRTADGQTVTATHEILRAGKVVGVLAVDPGRDKVVLLRQFRLAAHFATRRGELVEIVAGHVEDGEEALECARRECIEEIGIAPDVLVPLFQFMPAPGSSDELAMLFVAGVDASRVPERAGAADEHEETRPVCVSIDEALAALHSPAIVNGYAIIALQWLALNRHRLRELVGPMPAQ